MRYGFSNYPSFFDTNIRPGHIWEWDEDYPDYQGVGCPGLHPGRGLLQFTLRAPQYAGEGIHRSARIHEGWDYV